MLNFEKLNKTVDELKTWLEKRFSYCEKGYVGIDPATKAEWKHVDPRIGKLRDPHFPGPRMEEKSLIMRVVRGKTVEKGALELSDAEDFHNFAPRTMIRDVLYDPKDHERCLNHMRFYFKDLGRWGFAWVVIDEDVDNAEVLALVDETVAGLKRGKVCVVPIDQAMEEAPQAALWMMRRDWREKMKNADADFEEIVALVESRTW